MNEEFISNSAIQTKNLGKALGLVLKKGGKNDPRIFLLSGDLGSGKTAFVQGVAKGLGIKEKILSPTFVLMREFCLKTKKSNKLCHFDFYRLEKRKDAESIGLKQALKEKNALIFIEWPEIISLKIPEAVKIKFSRISENKRKITFEFSKSKNKKI